MKLTTTPQSSQKAVSAWRTLFESSSIPRNIEPMCLTFYGHALSKIGRDNQAIQQFNKALSHDVEDTTRYEARLGKSKSLQRLLRYEEASVEYPKCRAWMEAATCALRCGDLTKAKCILSARGATKEMQGMLGTILWMEHAAESNSTTVPKHILQSLKQPSFLYQWLYAVASKDASRLQIPEKAFLELASVNTSPFDLPHLVRLDDKVSLHILLKRKGFSFWPLGFVFPDEKDLFCEYVEKENNMDPEEEYAWILKEPAGYGSHGNRIVTTEDAIATEAKEGQLLCQSMIQPPLLLRGKKFSLRIYAVLILQEQMQVFLARQGLVKLASLPFSTKVQDALNGMHMTNSGREEDAKQFGLDFLKSEFEGNHWDFDKFWEDIRSMVSQVVFSPSWTTTPMKEMTIQHLQPLCIPKILGFDILVDEHLKPFLIEVNRFPGLEPRGKADSEVKEKVVRDAWSLAARFAGLSPDGIGLSDGDGSCLEEIV